MVRSISTGAELSTSLCPGVGLPGDNNDACAVDRSVDPPTPVRARLVVASGDSNRGGEIR
jgi:hypothetical protein